MNIFENVDMSEDQSSDFVYKDSNGKPTCNKASIQINWSGVTGTLDGTIKLYVTNDLKSTLITTVTVDSASNSADCLKINYTGLCKGVKLVYTKNNITAGTLFADVLFERAM